MNVATQLTELLGLSTAPVAIKFQQMMQSGGAAANLGCIGNRVYTDMGDGDLYYVIAGSQRAGIVDKLETIVHANRELEKFHAPRA